MKKFFANKDKFYALAQIASSSLLRLFASLLIARYDDIHLFSHYVVLITIYTIIETMFTSLYIIPALSQSHDSDKLQINKLYSYLHQKTKRFSIAVLAVGIIFLLFQSRNEGVFTTNLAFIISTALMPYALLCKAILQRLFKNKYLFIYTFVAIILQIAFIAICYHIGTPLQLGFWLGFIIGNLLLIFLSRAHLPSLHPFSSKWCKDIKNTGKQVFIGSIANTLCSRLFPFFLQIYSGAIATAHFGAAWTFIGAIRLFSMSIQTIIRPRLALHLYNDPHKYLLTLRISYLSMLVIGIFSVTLVYLYGENFISYIYGSDFLHIGSYLYIAFLYAMIDAITSIQMVSLQISRTDGSKIATRLRIFSAIISLLLATPGIYYFGAKGAWLALLIAEGLYMTLAIYPLRNTRLRPTQEME